MHRLGNAINMGATVAPSLGTGSAAPSGAPGAPAPNLATSIQPPSQTEQFPRGPTQPGVLPTAPGGGTLVNSGGQQ
jgi:hypothetical protein